MKLFQFGRFILRRSGSDFGLLAGVAVALLIATTVLGGGPVYLDSLTRAGTENTVEALSPSARNLLMVHRGMLTWEDLTTATSEAQTQADEWFPGMHGPVRRMATTPPYIRDTESDTEAWYAMRFQFVDELTENVDYVAGGPPGEAGPGILAEVSVYEPLAREFGISVGDTVTGLRIDREGELLTVRVSGLFQTDTLSGPFWMAYGRSMVTPEPIDGAVNNQQIGAPAGMFMNEDGLRTLMGRDLQDPLLTRWITPLDRDALMELGHEDIVEQVRGIEGRLRENVPGSQFLSSLDAEFEELGRRLVFARIPMFLIAALLLAIVIYYVLMSASTLASRRGDEINMLRSRGISLAQMGWMYALEAMFLVGVPVVLGPLLALLIVSQAGRLPLYDTVTGGESMPVSTSWESFALSVAAGLVTLAVMVAPALISGYGRVATRQQARARPEGKPFFQRYFLDAAVLAIGGFFVWELNSRGGAVISTGESGQLDLDLAILATPALFLLGVSLVFLRAFPPVARLLAWMARRAGPAWATLALWRISRAPYSYATVVLLLMLGSGLAVVVATMSSTLQTSAEERVQYQTGGDLRLAGVDDGVGLAEQARGIPGVLGATAVARANGQVGTTRAGPQFNVLALEPDRAGDVIWFREDFSDAELRDLMDAAHVTTRAEQIQLPEGASEISIWTRTDDRVADLFLWVTLRHGEGRVTTATLGPIEQGDWRRQTADISDVQHPAELISIRVYEPSAEDSATRATIMLDDVTVSVPEDGPEPGRHVIESFDESNLWTVFPTSEGFDTDFSIADEQGAVGEQPGAGVGVLDLGIGVDNGTRGIYRPDTGGPIPVVASESLISSGTVSEGEPFVGSVSGARLPLVAVDTVRHFPTMDPGNDSGFVLADLEALQRYMELRGSQGSLNDTEVLAAFEPASYDQARDELISLAPSNASVMDRRALERQTLTDPLTVAGWRGVGLLSAAGTLIVIGLGYATYVSAYSVRMRVEEGFLRTMGISTFDYTRTAFIEHVLVGAVGVVIGGLAGLAMSRIAVDASVQSVSGGRPLPPFNLVTEWGAVSILYAALGIGALVALAWLVRRFSGRRLHEITRLEE